MSAQPHEWERLDMSAPRCVHCHTPDLPFCPGTQSSVANQDSRVTLRHEVDRLARQMARLSIELQGIRDKI
jgi:hypothetical protein